MRDRIILLIFFFLKALFTWKKKVILFSIPTHPNLGDQAQLMCTEKWIKENFKDYSLLELGHLHIPFDYSIKGMFLNIEVWQHIILKLVIRKHDIFIGHSGYFFVDHHGGWYSYEYLLKNWPKNKFVIFPQTVNFYTPAVIDRVGHSFENKPNLTLLCRDEISYLKAKKMFGTTRLLLYPDIVTSLIGTHAYNNYRDGVLFCMRDDIEAFYSPDDIRTLMDNFGSIRKEKVDTTLKISSKEMRKHRDDLINSMIEKFSTYQVVITDRYHGTIFSAIADTPVIVINSADHKLSSGVKWFVNEGYGDSVQFANSLSEAYDKAILILQKKTTITNPPTFKQKYWDKLIEILQRDIYII